MKYGLQETQIDQIQAVLARYPEVEKALLFGSRAKGNYKPYSDIDVVLIGQHLSLFMMGKIHFDLDDLLLPYTFDMAIYHQISDANVLAHINRVGKVLYEKPLLLQV